MRVAFPRLQPDSAAPLVEALLTVLGDLVRPVDAARILLELAHIPLEDVASVGLEVTLPPADSACDLSVLLVPGRVPPFVRHQSLQAFADAGARAGVVSTWWEFDASSALASTGGFVQLAPGLDGEGICRDAIRDIPGLAAAFDKVAEISRDLSGRAPGMLGFFPDREPPTAAALIRVDSERLGESLAHVGHQLTACVSMDDPLLTHLHGVCPAVNLSVGANAAGLSVGAVEFSFGQPLKPMLDGRWREALSTVSIDGCDEAFVRLLDLELVHDFANFLPLTVLSGIDHLKLMPDGRLKAYVGILLFRRGVGMNALTTLP